MISILTALAMLAPAAHAQDCGVIEYFESDTADFNEDANRVEVTEVGSLLQLESGCDGECVWTLNDLDNGDGQPVGKLVDIDNDQDNQGQSILANRVWYKTPDDLNDCVDVEAVVVLECDRLNENTTDGDSVRVVTVSPYIEKCSVSGGGCIAPQGTGVQQAGGWLLLPLLGLVIRRREERP
ncbi:MAG: hypothetical protein VX127_02165 [Myxococcota bacterium]|nr:hypothetical protein [Myxococcota bacterium]